MLNGSLKQVVSLGGCGTAAAAEKARPRPAGDTIGVGVSAGREQLGNQRGGNASGTTLVDMGAKSGIDLTSGPSLASVRTEGAAQRRGVALAFGGGSLAPRPEQLLGKEFVVFGKARTGVRRPGGERLRHGRANAPGSSKVIQPPGAEGLGDGIRHEVRYLNAAGLLERDDGRRGEKPCVELLV